MAAVRHNSSDQTLDPDASVLDYARFHRICRDYARSDPLDPRYLPQAPIFLLQDLTDPPGCSRVQPNEAPDTSERLEIDAAAVNVLKTVSALQNHRPATGTYSNPRLVRHLKVEAPLLNTDHELDSIRFRKHDNLRLTDVKLPIELTDDEKDEGLSWPSQSRGFSQQFYREIESDRLEVQKQALLYLQSVAKQPAKPDIPEPAPAKRLAVQPVTPPLLPLSPEFTHVPDPASSSPTGQLQLLSGTTDSIAAEAESLEGKIFKEDGFETSDVPGLRSYVEDPMLWGDAGDLEVDELTPLPKPRRRAAELKVEVPLTPPQSFPSAVRSPAKDAKSVSFPDDMLEYITYPAETPSKYESGNSVLDSENDFDAFFEDIRPIANKADWRAENEQLQEADTTKRVEVPHLDFEDPVAPWNVLGLKASLKKEGISTELQAQARLLSRCAREELRLAQKWPESKKQDMELTWWAFPRNISKEAVKETIQYDAALNQVMGSSSSTDVDIVDSGSLAWKLEGLRILDQPDDEEEEISPWHFEPGGDLVSLLQKRKLEMADDLEDSTHQAHESVSKENAIYQPQKKKRADEDTVHTPTAQENSFMFGGMFSTSKSLDQFMKVSSGVMNVEQQPKAQHAGKEEQQKPFKDKATIPNATQQEIRTDQPPPPFSAPPVPNEHPRKPFVVSSSLLTHRRELIRTIQKLYPAAFLVERDYTKPLLRTDSRTPPPPAEPDLILSPSTGLLLTTLQRIKQRPLPGQQAATAGFQTELVQCAAKTPHLIVLVSASAAAAAPSSTNNTSTTAAVVDRAAGTSSHEESLLDARDCDALAALHGFAAACLRGGQHVTIAYVPGGEVDLARWIAGAMAAYGRTSEELVGAGWKREDAGDDDEVLKEEEGTWELFLRKAGLNAFAAQVVLARLGKKKGEGGDGGAGGGMYGLAAFVAMTPEERRRAFEGVVGSRELLDKVGRRVDGRWVTMGS
ncbi:hypothetical protein DIS24_g8202 [Lasiodiplodia hormozganensis]|uniref:Uncharacterized protein n=1 Tax=Lasiodiplodia hormozganensis TaxID=869390 RepID=A0AA39Y316_9PEZI|nr:hypothetical protein DIS24_g8202 [Lasiodiplodia hormozganensis]